MWIDPHVHCRDEKQAYKETIAHALYVAERAGLTALFDMPNTDPPVSSRDRVVQRLELAKKANSPVFYGLYMALTADADQVREAVKAYREFPEVIGFKLYAGHSVGNIGVTEIRDQERIYRTLKDSGYEGVVAVHCEKESLLKPEIWKPEAPATHALARPPEAEFHSVQDQIQIAEYTGFPGVLHIAHISVPSAVGLVDAARSKMRITCGATPHHLLLGVSRMVKEDGILYKMNPPLRSTSMVNELLEQLRTGKIDWVETDHAPHSIEEKKNPPYMSGLPLLAFYPRFVDILRKRGFTEDRIRDITFNRINETFGTNLRPREAVPDYQLAGEYPFDPFENFS